jgi:hypothetical protein
VSKATEDEHFGERLRALEKAIGAVADQPVSSEGKQPEVHMTLELFHRRKTMLITFHAGKLTPRAMQILADQFNTTPEELERDWYRRETWEPFIWENQEANKDGKKLLQQLQLAREAACDLMNNSRLGGNARVGAIAQFISAIRSEIELEQSLGQLPKQTQPAVVVNQNVIQQNNSKVESTVNILAEYEQLIAEAALAQTGNLQADNSGEPLHKAEANSKASSIFVA